MPEPAPARIWGFVASDAPRIVLLRRGPSRWTRMYVWNTETDEITAGSWFVGHIYYLGCDLSPDGEYFVYYATNNSKKRLDSARERFGIDYLFEWTTLCKPPYFKSCGTWTHSCLTGGGGHFRSQRSLALFSYSLRQELVASDSEVQVSFDAFNSPFEIGLHRTGWQGLPLLSWQHGHLNKKSLSLEWDDYYGFAVSRTQNYAYAYPEVDLGGVNWADLDQQGNLVYSRQGKLYRHTPEREQEIADLNLPLPDRPWLNKTQ